MENQIKMAKMVLMNELNKQANGLIEELEVYVDRWIRWLGWRSPWVRNQAHIKLVPGLRAPLAGIQICSFHSFLLFSIS